MNETHCWICYLVNRNHRLFCFKNSSGFGVSCFLESLLGWAAGHVVNPRVWCQTCLPPPIWRDWCLKSDQVPFLPCLPRRAVPVFTRLLLPSRVSAQMTSCTRSREPCLCCGAAGSTRRWPSSSSRSSSTSSTCGSSTGWSPTPSRGCARTTGGRLSASSWDMWRPGRRSRAWSWRRIVTSAA